MRRRRVYRHWTLNPVWLLVVAVGLGLAGVFVALHATKLVGHRRAVTASSKAALLSEIHNAVRRPYRVLSRYAEARGSTPYSHAGSEHALYLCRPYATDEVYYWPERVPRDRWQPADASVFDLPYDLARNGPAAWLESERRLVNSDFDYLNEQRSLDRHSPSFALYAAKPAWKRAGRWVVFCNGATLWISSANEYYRSPLGRSKAELVRAEPRPVDQPIGRLSTLQRGVRGNQLIDIWSALVKYADDHLVVPSSERGGDYALYMLKAYAPDPAIFDAAYTRLENGAAYYDDDLQRVANGDFVYLNEALSSSKMSLNGPDTLVILADEWGVYRPNVRWLLSACGFVAQVRKGNPHADNPLGKSFLSLGAGSIVE